MTSGATATIPSCQYGKVSVNDTTAPTIKLPIGCPIGTTIIFDDAGGNAGADTITIAAPSAGPTLTLSGSTTITTAHGRRTVVWDSPSVATVQ